MSDAPPVKQPDEGAPAWVMTFADLMSLLMCFFVLLLSFSEMDVLKFKQLAGSMNEAFGVQREIKAKEIPKGISVIAKEFSPGRPQPTTLNEVRQHTTDDMQRNLQVSEDTEKEKETETEKEKTPGGELDNSALGEKGKGLEGEPDDSIQPEVTIEIVEVEIKKPTVDATAIREALAEEIEIGLLDVEADKQRIIIRIQEKGAFPSGSASLKDRFEPVIQRIGAVLTETTGRIIVAGHTDDIPISTQRFRSNWELSAARSVTVVHHLDKITGISHQRFLIEGHADTQPLVPNDGSENRARNRRVEIIIATGYDDIYGSTPAADTSVNTEEKAN